MVPKNKLYCADNLHILRDVKEIPDESVDLIYLDPPYQAQKHYNVIWEDAQAQLLAFQELWHWTPGVQWNYERLQTEYPKTGIYLRAQVECMGTTGLTAYLVNMACRLVECRRVLKSSGNLFIHHSPTFDAYMKVMCDQIFGFSNSKREVIWKRTSSHGGAKSFPIVHDRLLHYVKDAAKAKWFSQYQPYTTKYTAARFRKDPLTGELVDDCDLTGGGVVSGPCGQPWRGYDPSVVGEGRHFAIPGATALAYAERTGKSLRNIKPYPAKLDALDAAGLIHWTSNGTPRAIKPLKNLRGKVVTSIWDDIPPVNSQAKCRTGPSITRKPVDLISRILHCCTEPGDVYLDTFCGCGPGIEAAHALGRQWIGIDITASAIDAIEAHLVTRFGSAVKSEYALEIVPTTLVEARRLARRNPFKFESWVVKVLGAKAYKQNQRGDGGVDGILVFHDESVQGERKSRRIVISVKSSKKPLINDVRALWETRERMGADICVFVSLNTFGKNSTIPSLAASKGFYTDSKGVAHSRFQLLTAGEVVLGSGISYPR